MMLDLQTLYICRKAVDFAVRAEQRGEFYAEDIENYKQALIYLDEEIDTFDAQGNKLKERNEPKE